MGILAVATVVSTVATYIHRSFAGSAVQIGAQQIGEFVFHNGILLPHRVFLYGCSSTGEPHIVGKKLASEDYSAWEAGYGSFAKLISSTFTNSGSTSTYSWAFEEQKATASFNLLQILFWLMSGTLCALLVHFFFRKIMGKIAHRKGDNEEETLAIPTGRIDVQHSMLNHLWRKTLIGMYQERKSEILSLSKLAVYYYDSSRDLSELVAKEKEEKEEARRALESLKAEHADKLAEQQAKIDKLRQELAAAKSTDDDESEAAEAPLGEGQPQDGLTPEAAGAGSHEEEEDDEGGAEQDEKSPVPEVAKPKKQRVNRRADGTIRTASHPDFVPLPPGGNRGAGWRGGRGGRGGNGGGRFGFGGGSFGFGGGRGGRGDRGRGQ